MQLAFINSNDHELNLILCKIHLYLSHHYLDIDYEALALYSSETCRRLCLTMDESMSYSAEVIINL